jgi:hypothetical protein
MDTLVSSSNNNDRHDITEILLKVTLNTIIPTKPFNTQTTLFAGLYSPRDPPNYKNKIALA